MRLPEVDQSPEPLYRLCYAAVQSNLLITAVKLNIFNYLSTPKTAQAVAKQIQGHEKNTLLFLNGLTACALLEKNDNTFQNAPATQAFLMEGTDTDLGPGFLNQAQSAGLPILDLSELVLNGPPSSKGNTGADPEQWGENAVWMANHQRAGIAQQMAGIISGLPGFSGFGKMLDLGGGPGMFAIAMVDRHPSMTGVVFDRGPVVRVAERFIMDYGLEERLKVVAGDYNADALGRGYDFIWCSSALNFAGQNLDAVMAKIHQALVPGGVFANLSEGLTHGGTQPDFYVLCTLVWAMTHPFPPFHQGTIAHSMKKAGFESVTSSTLATGWGPMDLDIAKK